MPITNLTDPYMASTPGLEPGPHWLEVSALTTLTTHTPPIQWRWIYNLPNYKIGRILW